MLSALKHSNTKNPRPGSTNTRYVMFDLEDMEGMTRCILWPEEYSVCGHLATSDAILAIRGVIDRRPGSDEINLICNELIPLDELPKRFTRGVVIRVDQERHAQRGLEQLYEILRGYPGNCELQLVLQLDDGSRVHLKSDRVRVDLTPELRHRVDDLLGPGNLKLVSAPHKPATNGNGAGRQFARRQ
jgi:DNA polymerase-3 subunit alpha